MLTFILNQPVSLLRNRPNPESLDRKKHRQTESQNSAIPICHINLARNPKLRGGERQTEILIRALAAQGLPRQRIIVLRHGPLADRFQDCPHIKVFKVRNRLSALFACLLGDNKFLLHAHETHAVQVAYVASLFRRNYLITRHVTNPIRPKPFSYAMYRNAHVVIALTKAIEKSVRHSLPDIPIVRIPNAWNPELPDSNEVQNIRSQFTGKFLIGHAGAMDSHEKGHSVLLQSARIMQPAFPDIQFILLGSGSLEKELRKQAKDLGNVHFAGWVRNPETWIAALDLFAFPSIREGLGSVLLDVLHIGCAVVASHAGGIPEIITKDCGILVPPNDAKALAEQLVRLYQSSPLRQNLARAGALHSKHYSPELMAQRYMEIYLSIRKSLA